MTGEKITALALACITFFLFGIFFASQLESWKNNTPKEAPTGMVEVEIIKHCCNGDGVTWSLLHTADGQRCYIYEYRGFPGDKFFAWPEDLNGYRIPNSSLEMMLPPPKIAIEDDMKAREAKS